MESLNNRPLSKLTFANFSKMYNNSFISWWSKTATETNEREQERTILSMKKDREKLCESIHKEHTHTACMEYGVAQRKTTQEQPNHLLYGTNLWVCAFVCVYMCVDWYEHIAACMNVFIVCVFCLFSSLHTIWCAHPTHFPLLVFRYLLQRCVIYPHCHLPSSLCVHVSVCSVFIDIAPVSGILLFLFRCDDKASTPKQLLYESQLLWFLYAVTPTLYVCTLYM